MIAVILLSMLNPATAVLGLVCGTILRFRVMIGAMALLCAACLLTLRLIPIVIPSAVIALAAWAAIGWLAAWGLQRVRKSRNSSATSNT